jgi:Family of unknown function (DUF5759)
MISVKDIQKIESQRRSARKDTYREILKQFDKKIRYAVEVGDRQVFLSTPSMLLGYPLYDVDSATVYLARQLRHLGYQVQELGGASLYVTWEVKGSSEQEVQVFDDGGDIPSLINLKKVASRIRGESGH